MAGGTEQAPISKFLSGGKTYITEAANYLEARGLTIQDIPIRPYHAKDHGLKYEDGSPYHMEGWAYCLRGPDGSLRDNQFVLRVCNYPAEGRKLFMREEEWEDRPKFVQCFTGEYLHYATPRDKVVAANIVMLHEKVTSAELSAKHLGVPSLAVNGCTGWSRGGELAPELRGVLQAMAPEATLVVCFDGDIVSNANILMAASRLKGSVGLLRPDISIKFPMVPDLSFGVGWDDWAVSQGVDLGPNWAAVLSEEGVEVSDVLPLPYLIKDYGVSINAKTKAVRLEQTADNYQRLLRFPRWGGVMVDYNGDVYRDGQFTGSSEDLFYQFYTWLERNVCAGYGNEVSENRARKAFDSWLDGKRRSVALELLRAQPSVSYDVAREAAERLVVDGFKVVGPMTHEETVETVLRMFRDTILRWSDDPRVDVQWVWSIIGPSGCGKSAFSKFLYEGLETIGYRRGAKGEINKSYPKIEEENRKARDCLVLALDDYNPSNGNARDLENMLYTLTSDRTVSQREPYARAPVEMIRRAVFFLSTTDKSREFIRSAKGSGERRFIVMEGLGTQYVSGLMRVNRQVLAECGLKLLVWAAGGAEGCGSGQATEYSERYVGQYVQNAPGMADIVLPRRHDLEQAMRQWYREKTGDYRFSAPMLITVLGAERRSGAKLVDFCNHLVECGARSVGQSRVWAEPGREVMKDKVFSVVDLGTFLDNLEAGQ